MGNVWEYFFKPVDSGLSDLAAGWSSGCTGGACKDTSADMLTLDSWHIWKLYDSTIAAYDPSHGGSSLSFNQTWWYEHRARAWELFGRDQGGYGVEFADYFVNKETAQWKKLLTDGYSAMLASMQAAGNDAAADGFKKAVVAVAPSTQITANGGDAVKVIGLHIRGTDKQCGIGGPIIAPENYYPLVDLYLERNPTALIFLATDSPSFLANVRGRYGARVIVEEATRSEQNALHVDYAGKLETYQKGFGAVVDATHLARCDFMLHANSAVSEFSHWLAGSRLHSSAYNMQFTISSQLQSNHYNVFGTGLADIAEHYQPQWCSTNSD